MNGILGFIDVLKDSGLEEKQRLEYLGIVNKSGERLLATINDILEISQLEAGEVKVHKREINIADLMQYHFCPGGLESDQGARRLRSGAFHCKSSC